MGGVLRAIEFVRWCENPGAPDTPDPEKVNP